MRGFYGGETLVLDASHPEPERDLLKQAREAVHNSAGASPIDSSVLRNDKVMVCDWGADKRHFVRE